MENIYGNIGGKLKALAKVVFVLESIAFFYLGLKMMMSDMGPRAILIGMLVAIIGPFVAWVSSWLLYAFGELVEKTSDNESNTRNILKELRRSGDHRGTVAGAAYVNPVQAEVEGSHKWLCDNCRRMRAQTPCEHCGKE